jgi:hypothetical protein
LFGFNDPTLTLLYNMGLVATFRAQYVRNQTSPEEAASLAKNNTISCGWPNTKRFQQTIKYQAQTNITFWNPPLPSSGSPGNYFGFFRRGPGSNEFHFWNTIARVLEMEETEQKMHKGVSVFRYRFLEREIENSTVYPPNAQFFQFGLKGLFNATSLLGSPIFYSWPHFYLGDPSLNSYFDGVRVGDKSDESFFDLQPIIGANCFSSRKLQANIKFGPMQDPFTKTNISQSFYFPQFWMNVATDITDLQATDMVNAINVYERALVTENILLFGGSSGVLIFFVLSVWLFWKRRNHWRMTKVHLLRMGKSTSEIDIDYGYGSRVGKRRARSSSESIGEDMLSPFSGERVIEDMLSPVSGERNHGEDIMSPIPGRKSFPRDESSTPIL